MCCLWCRTRTSLQWSSQWAPQTLGASCGLLVDIKSNIFWAPLYFWYVKIQEVIIGLLSGTHQTLHSWGLGGILLNGVPGVHIIYAPAEIVNIEIFAVSTHYKFYHSWAFSSSLSCMFWYQKPMYYFTICTFENVMYSSECRFFTSNWASWLNKNTRLHL